ncbi:SusC/RagA family TonB-linked outer membrane protein [Chitinophaga sp. GCM10012297]|uniref:SusC/RagA family TonB-linked outer membrane protein n=1 Tax=Chitinophaga chungangae TaxID=2821488 RepID=A0ABS3YKT9_9BACT|nr:SusC/RagA family TonB-linked outer membrane protein [Chitinophaga chungangae]MBO9155312.1 SusC/RagA family TonB-linked outer membrane protein [Chitinophaga chungangae]
MRRSLRLLAILSLVLLMLPEALLARQQKAITGTVLSEEGTPMPGVTVRISGSNSRFAQTDVKGYFSIQASPGEVLEFSFIGYETIRVTVGANATVNLSMKLSESALSEVVVTAMGIKKERKALGYSVQDIQAVELMKNKDPNLINSLNGKIAGLNITNSGGAPGSSASIIIRGGTSLERDNQPLFVIDGMPMDNSTGQGDNSAFDGSVNLSTTNSNRAMDINPEDIESISVLKGPAAAALYGLRAAAGAIIITTKKGAEGTVTGSVTSRYIANWVNRLPEQQSIYKQGSYYSGTFTDQTSRSWGDKFQSGEPVYDNMGDFFKTANAFDNSFTISGGSKTGNFFLSGSNLKQGGIVPTTDYDRSTVRFNGEQKIGRFTFGLNASYAVSETRKTLTGSGLWGSNGTGYMESIIAWPRNDDMTFWLNPDGTKHRLLPDAALDTDVDNPYWLIYKNPQSDRTNRFIGTAYVNLKITDWLDATYRLGVDNYTTQFSSLTSPGSSVKVAWQNGMLSETNRYYNYINSNFMLNFHKTFSDWDINAIAGVTTEDSYVKSNSARAENFSIPQFISINNAAKENQYFSQAITRKRLAGFYGDVRVGYKNMLFLSATGRNDISSTLPVKNQSFFYPSVSGSFVFTEILPKSNILSFGKIRASWAQVGKDAPPYQTATYLFGPELTIGGGFRNYWTRGNEDLKPETTTSTEFGAELRFLNGRLGLDVAYYINNSRDQILQPRVSNATAYILSFVNTGEIENKGVEVTINANPVKRKNFNWNMSLNMSHNKGVVKDLPAALPILYVTDVQVGNAKAASFDKGNFMGLSGSKWQTDESGNLLIDWATGYPLTSTLTTTPVGNREPNLLGGLNNSLSYRNFNFSMLWDFRVGGDIYNGTEYLLTAYGLSKRTENRGSEITFTGMSLNPATSKYEPVTKTVIASEKYYRDIYSNHAPFFITKTNWLRLRSVSLAYSLPRTAFTRIPWLKDATITATGTNLALFTNYEGMDPETSAAGAGVIGSGSVGIDYAGVPATSGFAVGLNLKF